MSAQAYTRLQVQFYPVNIYGPYSYDLYSYGIYSHGLYRLQVQFYPVNTCQAMSIDESDRLGITVIHSPSQPSIGVAYFLAFMEV